MLTSYECMLLNLFIGMTVNSVMEIATRARDYGIPAPAKVQLKRGRAAALCLCHHPWRRALNDLCGSAHHCMSKSHSDRATDYEETTSAVQEHFSSVDLAHATHRPFHFTKTIAARSKWPSSNQVALLKSQDS